MQNERDFQEATNLLFYYGDKNLAEIEDLGEESEDMVEVRKEYLAQSKKFLILIIVSEIFISVTMKNQEILMERSKVQINRIKHPLNTGIIFPLSTCFI